MAGFWAAWSFLTIIPLPGGRGQRADDLARSLPFFPLVGLIIALIMAALAGIFRHFLPPMLAAVLLTLCLLAVSGGFHLDGLADSADGLFSARPKERMLEIMRDSHIGVMGVIAVVMAILLKVAALSALDDRRFVLAAFLMPLCGRCLMIVNMAVLPYIRKQGAASLFYPDHHKLRLPALWALFLLYAASWYGGGPRALVSMLVSLLAIVLWAWFCRARIGGATGDTLGAGCELAETVMVLGL